MDERPVFIYALCEEGDTLSARYVGKTYNLKERYKDHLATREINKRTHKAHWIKKMLANGVNPVMIELECVPAGGDWAAAERKWIAYFKSLGIRLTNATEGGEGCPGRIVSDETRRKIGEATSQRKHSDETKAQIGRSLLGNKHSLGKRPSPETRAKMSESHKRRNERLRLEKLASGE